MSAALLSFMKRIAPNKAKKINRKHGSKKKIKLNRIKQIIGKINTKQIELLYAFIIH